MGYRPARFPLDLEYIETLFENDEHGRAIDDYSLALAKMRSRSDASALSSMEALIAEARRMQSPECRSVVLPAVLQFEPSSSALRSELIETVAAACDAKLIVAMLSDLASDATKNDAPSLLRNWNALLFLLSRANRESLLGHLVDFVPLIAAACGPGGMREIANAVLDAGRWWP